jgi:hypothetical protein
MNVDKEAYRNRLRAGSHRVLRYSRLPDLKRKIATAAIARMAANFLTGPAESMEVAELQTVFASNLRRTETFSR